MKKIILTLLLGIFALSLVAASDLYVVQHHYYDDDGDLERKSYHYFDKDYMENENRYPVYDYRYGYTHRTSKEYLDDQDWYHYDRDEERDYDRTHRKAKRYNDEWEYSSRHREVIDLNDWDYEPRQKRYHYEEKDSWEGDYSYKYVSWLGGYEKQKCHNSPPEGQLFYVRC